MYDILQNSFKTIVNSCKSGEIGSNGYIYREQVANGVQVIIDVKIKARRVIKLSEIESYFVQKNEEEDDGGNSKA